MGYGNLKSQVSVSTLRRIAVRAAGHGAVVRRAVRCRGGLFNTTLRVELTDGNTLVVRIAPPKDRPLMGVERALMRREVAVARWMKRAGLPVAAVQHADFTGREIDRDWVAVSCEPGMNWHYHLAQLSPRQNDELSGQLGALAKQIHAARNPDGWFGYPKPFPRHATWSGFVRAYAVSLERDLRAFDCEPLPDGLSPVRLAARMARVLDEIRTPRLVHGDLWPRNILIERNGGRSRITAVLDCDRGLWGDPRFEWVLYGYPFRPAFWKAYGPKELKGRGARLRNLLYRGCGGLQASIEEWAHFRHRKKAREMMGYAIRDLGALQTCLR